MNELRELAYRIDPVLWVREVLGFEPAAWQAEFLRAPLGASIIALTARQVGKTTTASWAIAHFMRFTPDGLCVIACPAQRCFSVQYHPEASPGPSDSHYLFRRFMVAMGEAV